MVEARDFESEEQQPVQSGLLDENGVALSEGESDEDPNQLPSAFFSQIPFNSQQMLNGGRVGKEEGA